MTGGPVAFTGRVAGELRRRDRFRREHETFRENLGVA